MRDFIFPVLEVLESRTMPSFLGPTIYGTGVKPDAVAVGDFNGDGFADIAIANSGSNSVSVLLGRGNGTFLPAVNAFTDLNPVSIAVGDFNGDGRLDIVTANPGDNTISVLLGNGNGTFQFPSFTTFTAGLRPLSVAVGDFNHDGKLDLAVANYDGNNVSVMLGNGNGSFFGPFYYAAGTHPYGVALGDFNRDGNLDLAVTNADNSVALLMGTGAGSFFPAIPYSAGLNPTALTVADFNNDGKLDVAVASGASNNANILLGNGDGTFQAPVSYTTPSPIFSITVADFNNDHKLDLVVGDYATNSISVLLGNGNGSFRPSTNYSTGPGPVALAIGDFNGDHEPDLAVAYNQNNTVGILLDRLDQIVTGADAGGLPTVRIFDAQTGSLINEFLAYDSGFRGGVRVATGDVNGDGVPDIITAPGASGGPDIRVFDGVSGALIREFMAYDHHFLGGVFVASADLNGDGASEIITAPDAGGGPDVRVYDGKSGQIGAEFMAYDSRFGGGVRIATGDVNADGVPDIITAPGAGGGPDIRVFEGATAKQIQEFFAYDQHFLGGVYVAAGDTNGDGKADIITGEGVGGQPQVKVFSGSDDSLIGNFLAYASGFAGGVRVAAADLTGNSSVEIITGPGSSGGPQVLVHDSSTFATLDNFYAYDPNFLGGIFVGGR